jgi:nucleoside-diphosphate-sugar epimerase
MKCLVIGGTGWLGHHVAMALRRAGHEVVAASRGRNGAFSDALPADVPRIEGDKTDVRVIGEWLTSPVDIVIDSLPQTQSIRCLAAHHNKFAHYIHCSSTGGYAPLPYVPGDEAMPYDHFMGGWRQKAEVDELALTLGRQHGFAATVIRPTYITGPGLMPLDNFGGRDPAFLARLQKGDPIILPGDGQALLQPVHVEDLAQSFRLAAEHRQQASGQIYIVSQPHAITLQQYVTLNAQAMGVSAKIQCVPVAQILAQHGVAISERGLHFLATHMCFSIARVQRDLGFMPRYGPQSAIAETVQWAIQQICETD